MKFALIIQGPVREATENVINYYIDKFQNQATIVFSTWDSENTDFCKNKKVVVIKHSMPANVGDAHRNCQRISTHYGLKYCEDIEYCLKVRSDHIFKHDDVLNELEQIINKFPLSERIKDQNKRIIVGNAGTTNELKWGKFHVGDFWMFGTAKDLIEYFDISNPYFKKNETKSLNNCTSVEPELCQIWMSQKEIDYPDLDSLLSERFIVLNNGDMNYNILKNTNVTSTKTPWNNGIYCDPLTVDFAHWHKLYLGLK